MYALLLCTVAVYTKALRHAPYGANLPSTNCVLCQLLSLVVLIHMAESQFKLALKVVVSSLCTPTEVPGKDEDSFSTPALSYFIYSCRHHSRWCASRITIFSLHLAFTKS